MLSLGKQLSLKAVRGVCDIYKSSLHVKRAQFGTRSRPISPTIRGSKVRLTWGRSAYFITSDTFVYLIVPRPPQTPTTRSSPFAPACFLSSLWSYINQLCDITLFSLALRIFSMNWPNRLGVFSFRSVSFSHAFFGLRRPLLLSFISKRIKSLNLDTFDIGYERLPIKYMLKQYSRFRFSCLLSNTIACSFAFFFPFWPIFDSPIASIGSLKSILTPLLDYSLCLPCLPCTSRWLVVYANIILICCAVLSCDVGHFSFCLRVHVRSRPRVGCMSLCWPFVTK